MDRRDDRTENRPSPTAGDYLWDRSGEPDREIQKLESLLGKFRHDAPAPVFPAMVPDRRWTFTPWRLRLFPVLATAALAVAAIVAATFVFRARPISTTLAGWEVSEVQGAPRIGRKTLSANQGTSRLGIG